MIDAKRVDQIFDEALNVPREERETLVENRCAGDQELAARVRSLLAFSDRPESVIEGRFDALRTHLWQEMLADDPEQMENLSGTFVGSWAIEKLIARGGLATVYQAQRNDGVYSQQVALKVLRRGLDTDDLVRRFQAERQILSTLEHPGIAKILDGGAMEDGRPFLVLEYVDGLPITEHCKQKHLDIRARVRLMIDVCHAIGHAHQRLVVHRDIKPSNILVTREGKASVLDFGIAKLLDPITLPAVSPVTRTGVSMLTPAYASPEQHAAKPITTVSDIYQLGLVFYELLSGERPFSGQGNQGFATLPSPSLSISEKGLKRRVQGDLDAIVHKAAHEDAERRYSSTDELIADLQRYLDGLPVLARPDSLPYRLGKLNRRKPWLMPLMILVFIAVTGYVVTLSIYSSRLAKAQYLTAATQNFLLGMFKSPDPFAPANKEIGSNISVVEALEIGYRRARTELADQPELKASLLGAISEVYASLDSADTAIDLRLEVLELERLIYGERSPQIVASMRALGGLYGGQGDADKAEEFLDGQLLIAMDIFDADGPELGLSEIAVGMGEMQAGNFERSHALLLSGVAKLRPESTRYARNIISALIASTEQQGMESPELAFAAIAEAQEIANATFGENSLLAATVKVRLAATLTQFGDYENSERNFLAAIPVLENQLGRDHTVTLSAMNNLGYLYTRSGKHRKAEVFFGELLERQIAKYGLIHRFVADAYQNLAGAITRQGRYDESLPLHRQAYDIYRKVLDDNHYIIALPLLSITYAELQSGNAAAAESTAREALARFVATVPGSFLEGVAQCLVGLSLENQGRIEEGKAIVSASHTLMKKGSIPDPYPDLCRLTDS
jgi:serine/threonine-protein kinase